MKQIKITWEEVFNRLKESGIDQVGNMVYGVPKGGMIISAFLRYATPVFTIEDANHILDDLVETGGTRMYYKEMELGIPFITLFDKQNENDLIGKWLVMPWEADHPHKDNVQQNIIRQLQYLGEDPLREGLLKTPDRIVKSWDELYSGYDKDAKDLFTTFAAGAYDEIVLLKNAEVYSMCEHHMLPFFGKAHVAYIPNEKVIGISKLARLVDIYARRLQIQERIGDQVVSTLMNHLKPVGAACIIEATHMCMRMRGVSKQNSIMTTSSMKGVFMTKQSAREELMQLIRL